MTPLPAARPVGFDDNMAPASLGVAVAIFDISRRIVTAAKRLIAGGGNVGGVQQVFAKHLAAFQLRRGAFRWTENSEDRRLPCHPPDRRPAGPPGRPRPGRSDCCLGEFESAPACRLLRYRDVDRITRGSGVARGNKNLVHTWALGDLPCQMHVRGRRRQPLVLSSLHSACIQVESLLNPTRNLMATLAIQHGRTKVKVFRVSEVPSSRFHAQLPSVTGDPRDPILGSRTPRRPRGPGNWELGTGPLGTGNLEPGTWNLELGHLEPGNLEARTPETRTSERELVVAWGFSSGGQSAGSLIELNHWSRRRSVFCRLSHSPTTGMAHSLADG